MEKQFDKIQEHLLTLIKKMENTASIKKKTIIIRDKDFSVFYKEINRLMGINAFKYLPNYKILLYDGIKQQYSKKSLRNRDKKYKTKTKVLINDKGLIESINERSNDLYNYEVFSHKYFTYDDDGFFLTFVHDDGYGKISTYEIITDETGNILHIDNHINKICQHNLPKEELIFRTKKLKNLMYTANFFFLDMLNDDLSYAELWEN